MKRLKIRYPLGLFGPVGQPLGGHRGEKRCPVEKNIYLMKMLSYILHTVGVLGPKGAKSGILGLFCPAVTLKVEHSRSFGGSGEILFIYILPVNFVKFAVIL